MLNGVEFAAFLKLKTSNNNLKLILLIQHFFVLNRTCF